MAKIRLFVSSMPKKPALGRGKCWTKKKVARVIGRWVYLGWQDARPCWVICFTGSEGYPRYLHPESSEASAIDSPDQIIELGEYVTHPSEF